MAKRIQKKVPIDINQPIKLIDVCNSVAIEEVEHHTKEIIRNIRDQHTHPTARREIILTFRVDPDEDRETATISVVSSRKEIKRIRGAAIYNISGTDDVFIGDVDE